jgi:hypothetical protein
LDFDFLALEVETVLVTAAVLVMGGGVTVIS